MNEGWHEEWIVVINGNEYSIDEKQAETLQEAITSGSRGIVQFKSFVVSIPYIEEFYLRRRWRDESYQIEVPADEEIAEEQKQKNLQRLAKMKDELFKKGVLRHA